MLVHLVEYLFDAILYNSCTTKIDLDLILFWKFNIRFHTCNIILLCGSYGMNDNKNTLNYPHFFLNIQISSLYHKCVTLDFDLINFYVFDLLKILKSTDFLFRTDVVQTKEEDIDRP